MRKSPKRTVDDLFRDAFSEGEVTPSPEVWHAVESHLDGGRRRRVAAWLMAAASVLIATVSAVFYLSTSRLLSGTGQETTVTVTTSRADSSYHVRAVPAGKQELLSSEKDSRPVASTSDAGKEVPQEPVSFSARTERSVQTGEPAEKTSPEEAAEEVSEVIVQNKQSQVPEGTELKIPVAEGRRRLQAEGFYSSDYTTSYSSHIASPGDIYEGVKHDRLGGGQKLSSSVNEAYSIGVQVGYFVSRKLLVKAGLVYASRKGEGSSLYLLDMIKRYNVAVQGQYADTVTVADTVASVYSLNLFEFPLLLRYTFLETGRVKYFLSSGVSGNFLQQYTSVNTSARPETQVQRTSFRGGGQPFQVNFIGGMGLQYDFGKDWSVSLEPVFRYGMPVSASAFVLQRPYSVSFSLGVVRLFR
jgi:hypothetical protein